MRGSSIIAARNCQMVSKAVEENSADLNQTNAKPNLAVYVRVWSPNQTLMMVLGVASRVVKACLRESGEGLLPAPVPRLRLHPHYGTCQRPIRLTSNWVSGRVHSWHPQLHLGRMHCNDGFNAGLLLADAASGQPGQERDY